MCPSSPRWLPRSRRCGAGEWTLRWYGELWRTPLIVGAFRASAMVAVMVGILAPLLGLLAALSIRELGMPRLILLIMLLPLFIPGVSMGLASAFLFRLLGIAPSLATIVIVQTLWALPFATLIILTAMSTFDPHISRPPIWPAPAAGGPFATSSCRSSPPASPAQRASR